MLKYHQNQLSGNQTRCISIRSVREGFFFPGKRFLQGTSTCKQNKRAWQGRGFLLSQSHVFPYVSVICQFIIQTKLSLAGFWSLDQAEISAGKIYFTVLSLPSHILLQKGLGCSTMSLNTVCFSIKQWAAVERRVSSLSQHLILIKFPSWWTSEYDKQFRVLPKCQAYNRSWFDCTEDFCCTEDFSLLRWSLGLIEPCAQQSWC